MNQISELLSEAAKQSHDPDTQTACFISNADGVIAAEANRIPDGVSTDGRTGRPEKYSYIQHAEQRAIASCARRGKLTYGTTMYLNWYPCAPCAAAIAQSGIKRLFCDREKYESRKDDPRYGFEAATVILREAGVEIEWLS